MLQGDLSTELPTGSQEAPPFARPVPVPAAEPPAEPPEPPDPEEAPPEQPPVPDAPTQRRDAKGELWRIYWERRRRV